MVSKEVARGIGSQSRSKSYHRRGLWAIKKKNGGKFPSHPKKEKAAVTAAKVSFLHSLPVIRTSTRQTAVFSRLGGQRWEMVQRGNRSLVILQAVNLAVRN